MLEQFLGNLLIFAGCVVSFGMLVRRKTLSRGAKAHLSACFCGLIVCGRLASAPTAPFDLLTALAAGSLLAASAFFFLTGQRVPFL